MLRYLLAFFELVSWIYELMMGDPGIFLVGHLALGQVFLLISFLFLPLHIG